MHWIDVLILILIAYMAIKGFTNGLILGLFRLVGLYLGTILAARYGSGLAGWFINSFNAPQQVGQLVGYTVIFLIIVIIAQSLAGMIKSLLDMVLLGWLDKAGGVLFGAIKALIIAFVVFWAITLLPKNGIVDGIQKNSRFHDYYKAYGPGLTRTFVDPLMKKQPNLSRIRQDGTQLINTFNDIDMFRELLDGNNKITVHEKDDILAKFQSIDNETREKLTRLLKENKINEIMDIIYK